MNELVKVNFHGQDIDCVRDDRGVWVSLRRLCDNVGIDTDSQRNKLKNKAWACTAMITAQLPEFGQRREMSMLHLDTVPMWLATIDADRVASEAKPKIELYQKECAKVLRDYWFGRKETRGRPVIGEEKKSRQLTLKLAPKTMDALSNIVASTGVNATRFVERAIAAAANGARSDVDDIKLLTAKRLATKERRLGAQFAMRTLNQIQMVEPMAPSVFASAAATIQKFLVEAMSAAE